MMKKILIASALSACLATTVMAKPAITAKANQPTTQVVTKTKATQLNINTATAEQLTSLPHVGPKMAARIVAYRKQHGDFKSLADLAGVRGISAKRVQALQGLAVAS